MHIAICDDEQNELEYLQELVMKYNSKIDISLFSSAESLLRYVDEAVIDVVLLDIEMDGINGFTAAEALRTMQNPPLIIFITNSSEYTYRGYEVAAFRYLPKPVSYKVLADVLSAASEIITPQKLTIIENGDIHVIYINSILYFEYSGRSLTVHTTNRKYDWKMKLSDVETLLQSKDFVTPHKGYLVNLNFVDSVLTHELALTNGVQLPISRRQKKEFEQSLFRLIMRK